jgi:hypothetical protein
MSHPKQVRLAGSVLDRSRHVCAFLHSKEEEYQVLLPFVKEALEEGERVVQIVEQQRRGEHVRRLEEAGIDVAAAERAERLEIRQWEDAYLQDGRFDVQRQLDLIAALLAKGKALGVPRTRITGGTDWAMLDFPGVHGLIEYESRLNELLVNHDDPVCCIYEVSKFSAAVIMDALRVHPAVIIGGIYQENPFYVPPDEFLRELRERGTNGAVAV